MTSLLSGSLETLKEVCGDRDLKLKQFLTPFGAETMVVKTKMIGAYLSSVDIQVATVLMEPVNSSRLTISGVIMVMIWRVGKCTTGIQLLRTLSTGPTGMGTRETLLSSSMGIITSLIKLLLILGGCSMKIMARRDGSSCGLTPSSIIMTEEPDELPF